jgi:hypothetical protein
MKRGLFIFIGLAGLELLMASTNLPFLNSLELPSIRIDPSLQSNFWRAKNIPHLYESARYLHHHSTTSMSRILSANPLSKLVFHIQDMRAMPQIFQIPRRGFQKLRKSRDL